MADSKLTALSALSPVLPTDILYVVSDPGGTPAQKKLTVLELLTSARHSTAILDSGGNELFKLTAAASATNEFTVANAANGGSPTLSATGSSDSNIDIALTPKGAGGVVLPSGTAGNPSLRLANLGTNGGLYASGSNLLNVSISGSSRLEIAAGYVGVPANPLYCSRVLMTYATGDLGYERTGAGVAHISNGTAGQWGSLLCGVRDAGTNTLVTGLSVGHQTSGTQSSNAAGLGIAMAFNINSKTVVDSAACKIGALWTDATEASAAADLVFYTRTAGAAVAEVVRFAGAGGVTMLSLAGTGSRAVLADANGLLSAPVSDERLKLNLQPLKQRVSVLALLPQIKPVLFNFNQSKMKSEGLGDFGPQEELGFTYQNLRRVLPQLTGVHANGYGFVKEAGMTAFLVEVAQAQQARIDALEAKIEAMEGH